MRKLAIIADYEDVRQLLLHETHNGVYVFPFASLEDGSGIGDDWYATVEEAEEACERRYGVMKDDWAVIDDSMEGCQQDWIAPVRVKGRDIGKPEWGKLERLEDGVWRPIVPPAKS